MKSKTKKYSIFFVVMVMVLVSTLAVKVKAADPTTGSLTIVAKEQQNNTTNNDPLKGVEYTLYKVDETVETTTQAESYITSNSVTGTAKTTGEDGTVVFDNIDLGRYYVKVTNVPDGVVATEDFIVELPRTNSTGTGWDYDITVEPKIKTAFGNLEFTKTDANGTPMNGVEFKLQVKQNNGAWVDYAAQTNFTTNSEGKITLNNLPSYDYNSNTATYRLVEVSVPDTGYIINNKQLATLVWKVNNDGTITIENESSLDSDLFTVTKDANVTKVTYKNEKPEVEKKVKNGGEYLDMVGAFLTDTVEFKVTAGIPMQIADMKTYKITDNIPQGLTLNRESIKIEATTADSSETVPTDVYTLSQTGLEVTFNPQKLAENNYTAIIITYTAKLNMEEAVIGGDGNVNTVTLEYTNKVAENGDEEDKTTTTDTAQVHTGALSIEKVEKGNVETKLAGAKFKIATTEQNAKDGIFVKDETGADIEVETNDQGQAVIEGLKYADNEADTSYWLVETQAPSYIEDGVTKYYNLLKDPVEVQVGKTTHESAVQIENGKGFDLPATGSIGLAIFTVVGIAVMAGAVVLNKKQKVQE